VYDAMDVPDLRREVAHRADDRQRDADRIRLRAEGRRASRSRRVSAPRRAGGGVDGDHRAV
jgi:hypothetical protein